MIRKKLIVLCMIAVVGLPWGVAWWMVGHEDQVSLHPQVVGKILTPPLLVSTWALRTLDGSEADLSGHWWLILVSQHCDKVCYHRLGGLRKVHIALEKEAIRVKRGVLVFGKPARGLTKFNPLRQFRLGPSVHRQESFGKTLDFTRGVVYVVDPVGHVVMAYDAQVGEGVILREVKRLLRGSHIG